MINGLMQRQISHSQSVSAAWLSPHSSLSSFFRVCVCVCVLPFSAFLFQMAPEVHHYILKPSLPLGQMELIIVIKGKRGSISAALLMEKQLWM